MLSYGDMAAEIMEHFINHDAAHGYSQISRNGNSEIETFELSDKTIVEFNSGDRDCSRLIQTCYVVIGVLPRNLHMWTGNERGILLSNDFREVDTRYALRGDVLLRDGHTAMYLGNGTIGEAFASEYGTIDGETGDQTGNEIRYASYDSSEWLYCFRCRKVRPTEEQVVKPMVAIVHPDGENTLYYVTEDKIIPIKTEQQKNALISLYRKATGCNLPMFRLSQPYFDSIKDLLEWYYNQN